MVNRTQVIEECPGEGNGHELDFSWALVGVLIGIGVSMKGLGLDDLGLVAVCVAALVAHRRALVGPIHLPALAAPIAIPLLLGVEFVLFVVELALPRAGGRLTAPVVVWLIVTACLGAAVVARRLRWSTGAILLFLVAYFSLLATWIALVDQPLIDVFVFHRDAVAEAFAGKNPYAMTFPDIYPPEWSDKFYGDGVSVGGTLQFGYPYPPLNLAVAALGAVLGDPRYGFLLCLTASVLVLWRLAGTSSGRQAAMLLAFSPVVPDVIHLSWTEPLVLLAFTTTAYAMYRKPSVVPWMFGVFLATKQYTILLAPLYLLTMRRPWRPAAILSKGVRMVGGLLLSTAPLALLDLSAYSWSVLELQFVQPFRADSLSILAVVVNNFSWPPPTLQVVAMVLAVLLSTIVVLRFAPQTKVGLTGGVAVITLSFLLLSKQAFANYYLFALGAAFTAAVEPMTSQSDDLDLVRSSSD